MASNPTNELDALKAIVAQQEVRIRKLEGLVGASVTAFAAKMTTFVRVGIGSQIKPGGSIATAIDASKGTGGGDVTPDTLNALRETVSMLTEVITESLAKEGQ